jgi:formate hydrogenlyase subunit 3/multisubunit Na+/H+ antiporter MnhD subunit
MSWITTLQAHTPELLLLLAWLGQSRNNSAADRRLGLLGALLALALYAARVFPPTSALAWNPTATFGGITSVDRLAALMQLVLCWCGVTALWQGHRRPAEVLGFLFATGLAVASLDLALTIPAVIFAGSMLAASMSTDAKVSPPRVAIAILVTGAIGLAVACTGLSYRAMAIGMSQGWLEQSIGFKLAMWLWLSLGFISMGKWALIQSANQTAEGSQRLFLLSAAPVALFAIWLRLSTALFSGVIEGSTLEPDQGLLERVQVWIVVVALLFLIRSFQHVRAASDWLGQLAAAVPLQVGLWLLSALALNQEAVSQAAFALLIFSLAAAGLARPGNSSSRIHRLGWILLLFAWIGLPPTAGFHHRWLLAQSLIPSGEILLPAAAAIFTLLLLVRLLPAAIEPESQSESGSSKLVTTLAATLLVLGFGSLTYLARLADVGKDAIYW